MPGENGHNRSGRRAAGPEQVEDRCCKHCAQSGPGVFKVNIAGTENLKGDIQAHEDRKDQKKLVVQVIRTLLGGKMAQNDELDDHGCNQEIGIVTHIYFSHSYNNFEIFEYFPGGSIFVSSMVEPL